MWPWDKFELELDIYEYVKVSKAIPKAFYSKVYKEPLTPSTGQSWRTSNMASSFLHLYCESS